MESVIEEIISPSGVYKAQIIKRSKDGLFTSQVFKWIEHDEEISEIIGEKGFWSSLLYKFINRYSGKLYESYYREFN
ncbi:hypothetical protein DFP94_1011009 [Fontibacillus phaseoli]|uniref:Uncharacterized protein n=1 Tax=Fontibacillus phaseoli TaxID=1416533 RepID=A0A369BP64_9BACL|nr:hypothetical protein [Fontibacillus phaseoli]RCX23410.1 hypothetical protein DFP94_1011009 [Fontibacillus phaseoli]